MKFFFFLAEVAFSATLYQGSCAEPTHICGDGHRAPEYVWCIDVPGGYNCRPICKYFTTYVFWVYIMIIYQVVFCLGPHKASATHH